MNLRDVTEWAGFEVAQDSMDDLARELDHAHKRIADMESTCAQQRREIDALRAEKLWATYTLSKIAEARPARYLKSSYQMAREAMAVVAGEKAWERYDDSL